MSVAELMLDAAGVAGLVVRGVVRRATQGALQRLQVAVTGDDDLADDIEHAEPLGLTVVPLDGAEVIVANIGGDAGHPVALQVFDRAHRPTDLASGEGAVYNCHGVRVNLKASTIELGDGATLGVARETDPTISTSAEDATYWAWLSGFAGVFTSWTPVPNDGGAALKAAMIAYITTNPVPSQLAGKIDDGSAVVLAVD